MAVTVTQSDLKELLGVPSTVDDYSVAASMATLVVTEDLSASGMSSARLDQIALLLAAHFVTLGPFHGGLRREETGESSESYQDNVLGQGLDATLFGQQAKALDFSGILIENTTTNLEALFSVIQPTIE